MVSLTRLLEQCKTRLRSAIKSFLLFVSRNKLFFLFVAKRAGIALSVVFTVISLVFIIVRLLPMTNPIFAKLALAYIQGENPEMVLARLRPYIETYVATLKSVGIDPNASIAAQYFGYMSHVLRFDFGTSLSFQTPVWDLISTRLPYTLFTVGVALVLQFLVGIAIGMILAYKRGTKLDTAATFALMAWRAFPDYIVGYIILFLAVVYLYHGEYLAVTGVMSPWARQEQAMHGLTLNVLCDILQHAFWPILAYAVVGFAGWALAMRSSAINVLGEDYVTVAEARGLESRRIALTYVGRNAVLPLFTSFMICLGYTFGGSLFIEKIFRYEGLGYTMIDALWQGDIPLFIGCLYIEVFAIVVAVYFADVLYGLIDPRVRTS